MPDDDPIFFSVQFCQQRQRSFCQLEVAGETPVTGGMIPTVRQYSVFLLRTDFCFAVEVQVQDFPTGLVHLLPSLYIIFVLYFRIYTPDKHDTKCG